MQAKTPEEYLAIIDKAEAEQIEAEAAEAAAEEASDETPAEEAAPSERPFVVGVTACPTGIAHTYMAAEALENKPLPWARHQSRNQRFRRGKKSPDRSRYQAAVGVIVAVDKDVPVQRFAGKKVIFTKVANGIKIPEELIQTVLDGKAPVYQGSESSSESVAVESAEKESVGRQIYKHLMNGVSHMLPFVIGGGILIALAFLFDMDNAGAANFGSGTPVAALLKNIGGLSFSMMMPILAGYIAMSIGERPGSHARYRRRVPGDNGRIRFLWSSLCRFHCRVPGSFIEKVLSVLPESLEARSPSCFIRF